jgi:hypothetical protein
MSVAKALYGVVLAALAGFGNSAANAAAASHDQIFAHVKANGVAIYQKGVSNIIHPQTGTYCILPTSPALQAGVTTGVVAPNLTLDYGYTPDELVTISFGGTNTNLCPNEFYMVVYGYYVAPGVYTPKDVAFVLSFN